MDLLTSHFQDNARRAAGTFLTPLTNAIGEQRRLVDGLAVVSKTRVLECQNMMVWAKSQTDDIGDVLLKLNLLVRKISDYEIRFGTQYESYREKVKYLRTKDDTVCEIARQSELQTRIVEASKSRLRSAKAALLQREYEDPKDPAAESKLQHLKRQLIKDAYTIQLDAVIELGKKLQIIGEHGKQLLEHIDLPDTPGTEHDGNDGRKTEDILQSARIALESWDKLTMVNPQSVVVHPPAAPVSLTGTATTAPTVTVALSSASPTSSPVPSKPSQIKPSTAPSSPARPPLPPRNSDITPVTSQSSGHAEHTQKPAKATNNAKIDEEEKLRQLEELEIKKAMELSLTKSPSLKLTPEEKLFVMGEAELKHSSTKVLSQPALTETKANAELDIVAPKTTAAPKVVRGPQASEIEVNRVSQQGPRPWVPEEEAGEDRKKEEPAKPTKPASTPKPVASSTALSEKDTKKSTPAKAKITVQEELASASHVGETMGEHGAEPTLESMGPEPERALESMGPEPMAALESMGNDGHDDQAHEVPYVPMPQMPSLDGIREQKLMQAQQRLQQEQLATVSPELQYLQIQNSPQFMNQQAQTSPQPAHGSAYLGTPGSQSSYTPASTYQSAGGYQPSTTYVPGSKKQNRLSGSHTPPTHQQGSSSPASSSSAQFQSQSQPPYTTQYVQQQQRQYLQQQQQQLHDFYYNPQYQFQDQQHSDHQQQGHQQQQSYDSYGGNGSVGSYGWNVPDMSGGFGYGYNHSGSVSDSTSMGGPSPSPSHISLIPDNGNSAHGQSTSGEVYKVEMR